MGGLNKHWEYIILYPRGITCQQIIVWGINRIRIFMLRASSISSGEEKNQMMRDRTHDELIYM